MLTWLTENLSTLVTAAIIALLVTAAVLILIRSRRRGKSCGCGCDTCTMRSACSSSGQAADPKKKNSRM